MRLKHLQIHVHEAGDRFVGSWRVCESHDLDHESTGESDIPLGKRLTRKKLEGFLMGVIAAAGKSLLAGKTLVEVFKNQ